jgi:hypothetical protein
MDRPRRANSGLRSHVEYGNILEGNLLSVNLHKNSVASGLPNRTDGLLPPAWGSNKGLPPQHAACGGEAGQSWIPTFPSYTLRQLRNVTVPSTMYPDYLCEQSVNQLSMLHLHGYVSTCLCLASIPSTVYVLLQHVTVPTNLFSCTYSPSTSFLRSST